MWHIAWHKRILRSLFLLQFFPAWGGSHFDSLKLLAMQTLYWRNRGIKVYCHTIGKILGKEWLQTGFLLVTDRAKFYFLLQCTARTGRHLISQKKRKLKGGKTAASEFSSRICPLGRADGQDRCPAGIYFVVRLPKTPILWDRTYVVAQFVSFWGRWSGSALHGPIFGWVLVKKERWFVLNIELSLAGKGNTQG